MIDDIFIRNDLIPAGDHRFMHLRHCLKGAWGKVIVPEQGCMKIVGIRRKNFIVAPYLGAFSVISVFKSSLTAAFSSVQETAHRLLPIRFGKTILQASMFCSICSESLVWGSLRRGVVEGSMKAAERSCSLWLLPALSTLHHF